MKSSYKVIDNSKQALSALQKAKINGLRAIGFEAEGTAKEDPNMPVDTGRARNSITFALAGEEAHIKSYTGDHGEEGGTYSGTADGEKGSAVYIGSNVVYFPVIELGGRNMKARHVLQNAASSRKKEYKKMMENSMKNA